MKMRLGIPALCAGILFWASATPAPAETGLARQLYAEGDWAAARLEYLRLASNNTSNRDARVMADACLLRLGGPSATGALTRIEAARTDTGRPSIASASLAAGEYCRRAGRNKDAWNWFSAALVTTADAGEFLAAGAALTGLGLRDRSLIDADPAIGAQLGVARDLWTRERVNAASPSSRSGGVGWWVTRPVVELYRAAIRPAIGQRCNLHPSCSEYFLQAGQRDGCAALPMIADRLVREPSVNRDAAIPVKIGNQIRFSDPITDHDFWRNRRAP